MYAMTDNRKLSEIRQLGNRVTRGFQRLGIEQRRAVVERLDTVTAETLRAAVRTAKSLPANNAKGRE